MRSFSSSLMEDMSIASRYILEMSKIAANRQEGQVFSLRCFCVGMRVLFVSSTLCIMLGLACRLHEPVVHFLLRDRSSRSRTVSMSSGNISSDTQWLTGRVAHHVTKEMPTQFISTSPPIGHELILLRSVYN